MLLKCIKKARRWKLNILLDFWTYDSNQNRRLIFERANYVIASHFIKAMYSEPRLIEYGNEKTSGWIIFINPEL
ncbi:hypothetical protein BD408DRAFT_73792 [Parasitella parasitica]|nr:hypothetical protein BD408DRAFT_73792 [Parasitella parasitica]